MKDKIECFFNAIKQKHIELYSESGLQHELAIFLRNNYQDLTVRLEYPTSRIYNPLPEFIKREIDIYVTVQSGNEYKKYAIELKMPKKDSGVPNEMYSTIEDVKFLEQLKQNHFDGCYAILITNHQAFWDAKRANSGIYQLFNSYQVNIQSIDLSQLPDFLHHNGQIALLRNYKSVWNNYTDTHLTNWKCYLLEL